MKNHKKKMDVFPSATHTIPIDNQMKMCLITALWKMVKDECSFDAMTIGMHRRQMQGCVTADDDAIDLDMALVYHILSPQGVCALAKPLWEAIEKKEPIESFNPVIDLLVTYITELLPFATSSSRVMSAPLTRQETTMEDHEWVDCVPEDGKCACSVCKPYRDCFDLFNKYKTGDLSAETAKMVQSLELSPVQLQFLQVHQLV